MCELQKFMFMYDHFLTFTVLSLALTIKREYSGNMHSGNHSVNSFSPVVLSCFEASYPQIRIDQEMML